MAYTEKAVPAGRQGYGKRSLWQWILIYVAIGGVVYGAIYYFFLGGKTGYSSNPSAPTQQSPSSLY